MLARLALGFIVFAGCSNAPKQHDAAPPKPAANTQPQPSHPSAQVVIETPTGEVAIKVDVVATEATIQRGLMFREFMPVSDGMLFLMPEEKVQTFWMHNTLIPLDMIFITRDFVIAGIVENAAPRTDDIRTVGKTSLYVLEVNGGVAAAKGIKPGAHVRFDGISR